MTSDLHDNRQSLNGSERHVVLTQSWGNTIHGTVYKYFLFWRYHTGLVLRMAILGSETADKTGLRSASVLILVLYFWSCLGVDFCSVRTRNLWHIKARLRLPPHLYFVTALPSKTHTTANIDATNMFDLLMLMAHKQCCVAAMLNKRRYTSEIAVFDMFTVILPNTFNFYQDRDTMQSLRLYCQWNVVIFFQLWSRS